MATKNERPDSNQVNEDKSIIKIGTFELQTKSFWLGLVGILTLFMTAFFYINSVFWYKINKDINETNKELVHALANQLLKNAK